MKTAYFAGGCFWCITPAFRLPGVKNVVSGYCGGDEESPSYQDVKAQKTGHRETVAVTYDESVLSYEELLASFLENVDPFDEGGQFIDRGRSYTLAVYYQGEEEREKAEKAVADLGRSAGREACVAIEPFKRFYEAEEYHQDYDLKHPEALAEEMELSGRNSKKHV